MFDFAAILTRKKSTSNTGAEYSTTYLRMGKHPTKDTLVKAMKEA